MEAIKINHKVEVIYDSIPNLEVVSIGLFFDYGSKYDSSELHGVAHFIEHMLFNKNEKYKDNTIQEIIESFGGTINAFTTKEYICVYVKVLCTKAYQVVELLYDFINYPEFNNDEVEKEKNIIINEIYRNSDNNNSIVFQKLMENSYPNSYLAYDILGSVNSIKNFYGKELKEYYHSILQSVNICISISGKINIDLKNSIEKTFSSMYKKIERNNNILKKVQLQKSKDTIYRKGINQNYLGIGYNSDTYTSSNLNKLLLTTHTLTGTRTSFLNNLLREKKNLVYLVNASNILYQETGLLYINLSCSNKNNIYEIENYVSNSLINDFSIYLSEERIETFKLQLQSKLIFSMENTTLRMLEFGKNRILGIDINYTNQNNCKYVLNEIEKIEKEDIVNYACNLFSEPLGSVVLAPCDVVEENE